MEQIVFRYNPFVSEVASKSSKTWLWIIAAVVVIVVFYGLTREQSEEDEQVKKDD